MAVNLGDFERIFTDNERSEMNKKELAKLKKIFKKIEPTRRKLCDQLIINAAWMNVQLNELSLIVDRDGPVELYQNGSSQTGTKQSAASLVYDKMANTYSKTIKQLCELLPEAPAAGDPAESLLNFVAGNNGRKLR